MYENRIKLAGVFGQNVKRPFLIPSFNNGWVQATQLGNVVTVVCENPHNIPSSAADAISNTGVYVRLQFAFNSLKPVIADDYIANDVSGFYGNITVVDANTFTCLAGNNQTITSPQRVMATGGGLLSAAPAGVTVPKDVLKTGSTLRWTSLMLRAMSGVTVRNMDSRGRTISATHQSAGPWGTGGISSLTRANDVFVKTVTLINERPDSDFVLTDWGTTNGTSSIMRVNTSQNLNSPPTVTVVNSLTFNSAVSNDWALIITNFIEVIG